MRFCKVSESKYMIEIRHQLESKDWFIPDWKLRVLILGTFNPECGDPVHYFYGRKKNQLWSLVSCCIGRELHPNQGVDFFIALKEEGFGCMDLLRSIRVPEERQVEICGKGYSDQTLFRGTNHRTYMTDEIIDVINGNPGVCVLSTWGKGSGFKKRDWDAIGRLPAMPELPSPSPIVGGVDGKKTEWCTELKQCLR